MNKPLDFVRFRVTLAMDEMRAYIVQAFTPKEIEPVVDAALERARAEFPAYMKQETDAAIREAVTEAIKSVARPWQMRHALEQELRPAILRALARGYAEAAAEAEKTKEVKP